MTNPNIKTLKENLRFGDKYYDITKITDVYYDKSFRLIASTKDEELIELRIKKTSDPGAEWQIVWPSGNASVEMTFVLQSLLIEARQIIDEKITEERRASINNK